MRGGHIIYFEEALSCGQLISSSRWSLTLSRRIITAAGDDANPSITKDAMPKNWPPRIGKMWALRESVADGQMPD